jgi:hypothetical protein
MTIFSKMRSHQFLRDQSGDAVRRGSVANIGITLNPLHAKFKVCRSNIANIGITLN